MALLHSPAFAKHSKAVIDLSDGDIDDPETADVIREAKTAAIAKVIAIVKPINPVVWWWIGDAFTRLVTQEADIAVEKWIADLIAKAKV